MVESGKFYKTFIDPLLTRMRKNIASEILPGERVIDIACGTGAQVFEFAAIASVAVGVDLSESMIETAKKESSRKKTDNTKFYVADATNLKIFKNQEFDVAIMSLALHQFNPDLYKPILDEMKRISKRLVIADYAVPLPSGLISLAVYVIEYFAGSEHFRNFKKYNNMGGMKNILTENKLILLKERKMANGIFNMVVCRAD